MATLTGNLADVTNKTPENISSITVKAPAARIGGSDGSSVIVSSPAQVDFNRSTGDITINNITEGLSWVYIEGDGWSDSIALAVAEGMVTLVEAVANASGVPGLIDFIALLVDLQTRIDNVAQDAVDAAVGEIQWNKGNSTSLSASTASDLPGLVTEIWSSSAASQLGLPVAARGLVFGDQFGTAGWQAFIAFEASGPITYERSKTNDAWTDWARTTPDYTGFVSVTSSNVRPDLASADELPNGPTEVWSTVTALDWGLPVGALGTVYTQRFGNAGTQIFVAGTGSDTELWARSRRVNVWSEWKRYGSGGSAALSAGHKTVPLAMTLPGGNTTQTQAAGSVRVVRQWAHMPKRVRVHIRNGNPANGTNVGAMSISAKVGAASAAGALRETVNLGAVNLPASGEWVSKWITLPNIADGEYLGIAAGFTGASTSQAMMQGGGWAKHSYEGWDQAAAPNTGWTKRQTVPFYMWIEAEVPSTAPVTLVAGDSISIGTATDNPVTDSWVAISALERGALPVFYSQHGSTMEGWAAGSTKWDGMYPGVDVTADAAILALGQNDLLSANLSALKTRYASVVDEIESRWPAAPRFAGYVTPSNKEPSVEAIRKNFNSWLAGLPHNERGVLDVASVVGTSDGEDLRPEYSADTLHPNTAGQKVMAAVLTSAQVAPVREQGDDWVRRGILNGEDLNDFTENGLYLIQLSNTMASLLNRPFGSTGPGFLSVTNSDGTVIQELTNYSENGPVTMSRTTQGGVFQEWVNPAAVTKPFLWDDMNDAVTEGDYDIGRYADVRDLVNRPPASPIPAAARISVRRAGGTRLIQDWVGIISGGIGESWQRNRNSTGGWEEWTLVHSDISRAEVLSLLEDFTPETVKTDHVVTVGDSQVGATYGWANLLAGVSGQTVVNRGKSGNTPDEALLTTGGWRLPIEPVALIPGERVPVSFAGDYPVLGRDFGHNGYVLGKRVSLWYTHATGAWEALLNADEEPLTLSEPTLWASIYADFAPEKLSRRIVWFGGNSIRTGRHRPDESLVEHVQKAYSRAIDAWGETTIVCGYVPAYGDTVGRDTANELNTWLSHTAPMQFLDMRYRIQLAAADILGRALTTSEQQDIANGYLPRPLYRSDLVHLTDEAHVKIAEIVSEFPRGASPQISIRSNPAPVVALTGTGSPEGKVAAPVGSTYTDTAATNGAIRWIKASGTGVTGWRDYYGDTIAALDEAILGIGNPEQSADELRDPTKTYYWSLDANATGKSLPVDRAGVVINHRMSFNDSSTVQTYLPFRDPNLYVRYFYQNAPHVDGNTDADGWIRFPSSKAVESLITDAIANIDTGGGEDTTPERSSLTSITCFGDSLTDGYSNNVRWGDEESYPAALGRELGAGVTVTERGMPGATSATINLRAGATPVTFRVPAGTIPGARWSVIPLETSQKHDEWASGAVSRYGYIGGGYGTLKLADGAWTFTRGEPVDDMTADVVTFLGEFKDAASDTIIYGAGRNDITKNQSNIYASPVESAKASVIEMLAFSNAQTKQVAFLGTITRTDETPESAGYKQVYEINDWIRDRYPDRHIDLQGYLTGSQVWADTGITPTQADLDAQAQGMTPPSLFDDVTHYSKATAEAIGSKLVAGWLRTKGWVV